MARSDYNYEKKRRKPGEERQPCLADLPVCGFVDFAAEASNNPIKYYIQGVWKAYRNQQILHNVINQSTISIQCVIYDNAQIFPTFCVLEVA